MPKWGNVNERRNQLHEVIRLSGMNIIIDDTDHPLIIKVASIQAARRQVYFIDNDDYFQHRLMTTDEEGKEYEDNGERAIFMPEAYWKPLKTSLVSGYHTLPRMDECNCTSIHKKAYYDEPSFRDSKVIFSVYGNGFQSNLVPNFKDQILFRDITSDDLNMIADPVNHDELCKLAITYSDGVIQNSENVNPAIMDYARSLNIPVVDYQPEDTYADACNALYDKVWEEAE